MKKNEWMKCVFPDYNPLSLIFQISELDAAFVNDDLPSSINFFQSRPRIEESKVFQFIRELPKGDIFDLRLGRLAELKFSYHSTAQPILT